MSEKISKLEFSNVSKTDEQVSTDAKTNLNDDLLKSEELSEVEGGFCDYACIACSSSGLLSW